MNMYTIVLVIIVCILAWFLLSTRSENIKLKKAALRAAEEKKRQLIIDMRGWRAISFVGESDDAPPTEYKYQVPQSLNIHDSKNWEGPVVIKSPYQISRESGAISLAAFSPSTKK